MEHSDLNTWLARDILVHERALRRYIARFFSEPSDVEDVVQETYAHLLGLNETARAQVRGWQAFLFATAHNVALDRIRKQRVVRFDTVAEIDKLHVFSERPTPYEELGTRQELALLAQAIAQLPERARQVLTLRKLFGKSQKEIAERLGIAESTVEKHVANGVRLCAKQLFALREPAAHANGEQPETRDKARW